MRHKKDAEEIKNALQRGLPRVTGIKATEGQSITYIISENKFFITAP